MDRRSFLKLMGGIAALPVVGKYFKLAKPASQVAGVVSDSLKQQGMPDFFYAIVDGVKKFGKKVEDQRDYDVYEFVDPKTKQKVQIYDGPEETGINFTTDKETGATMSVKKGQADETTKGQTPPDEYSEYEEYYRATSDNDYFKDFEEEITGGYEGLEKMAEQFKKGDKFAEGGLANLTKTVPPAKGPMSEGVATLFERR